MKKLFFYVIINNISHSAIKREVKMTLWNLNKKGWKDSTAVQALQTAVDMQVAKAPLVLADKSFYQLYLELNGLELPIDNTPLSEEEMSALIDSMTFLTPVGYEKIDVKKIKEALHLLNQKSPTGRLVLKQIPPGLKINTKFSDDYSTYAWMIPSTKNVFLNRRYFQSSDLKKMAVNLAHEFGHVVEYGLVRPFTHQTVGYYDERGNPFSFETPTDIDPKYYFMLRKLSEAEKRGIDYQIMSELTSFGEIGRDAVRWLYIAATKRIFISVRKDVLQVLSFFLKNVRPFWEINQKLNLKNWSESLLESWQISIKQKKASLERIKESFNFDFLKHGCRYIYFETLFKFFPPKEILSVEKNTTMKINRSQADLQQVAAQKAISGTIKGLLNFSPQKETMLKVMGVSGMALGSLLLIGGGEALYGLAFDGIGMGSGLALIHNGLFRRWNTFYNRDIFNSLLFKGKTNIEKSETFLNNMLRVFFDKYGGFLTPEEISMHAVDNWKVYANCFKRWQKIQRLDERVRKELYQFIRIQQDLEYLQKNGEDLFLKYSAKQQENFWRDYLRTAEIIYDNACQEVLNDPSKSVDASVRSWILDAYKKNDVHACASDSRGMTMLDVTKDPNLILFLIQRGVSLKQSRCRITEPLKRLKIDMKKDACFQKDLEQRLSVRGRKQILRKLIILSQCYSSERNKKSLHPKVKKHVRGKVVNRFSEKEH